jgi:ribosomal protein L30E
MVLILSGKWSKVYLGNLSSFKKVKMDSLRYQMEKAVNSGKLAVGIQDVWKKASQHRGHLLIVEKDFMCCAQQSGKEEIICMPIDLIANFPISRMP